MSLNVLLGLSGAYTVSMPGTGNALSLSITNPDGAELGEKPLYKQVMGHGGLSSEGAIFVYHGGPGGLSTTVAFRAESDQFQLRHAELHMSFVSPTT